MASGDLRLFMTADAVGGVLTYALDLARGMASRSVRTTLAVIGPPPSLHAHAEAADIRGLELLPTGLALDWTAADPGEVTRGAARLAGMARDAGASVVQINSAPFAAADYGAPVVVVAHSCVGTWWEAVRGGPLPADLAWRAEQAGRGYRTADVVVAPSCAFARATAESHRLRRAPVIVPNGRAPLRLGPRPAPARLVFTAGRLWDPGKNIAVLDAAAAHIRAPVLAAGALVGPHGERAAFARIAAMGEVSAARIARTLATRPIFVSPSLYEPFGLGVLEAAQAGCALVLADIPTFRELWGEAALFFNTRDSDALAAALNALLADDDARAALGARAQARAARYSLDRMVAAMAGLYRSLTASPEPRRRPTAARQPAQAATAFRSAPAAEGVSP